MNPKQSVKPNVLPKAVRWGARKMAEMGTASIASTTWGPSEQQKALWLECASGVSGTLPSVLVVELADIWCVVTVSWRRARANLFRACAHMNNAPRLTSGPVSIGVEKMCFLAALTSRRKSLCMGTYSFMYSACTCAPTFPTQPLIPTTQSPMFSLSSLTILVMQEIGPRAPPVFLGGLLKGLESWTSSSVWNTTSNTFLFTLGVVCIKFYIWGSIGNKFIWMFALKWITKQLKCSYFRLQYVFLLLQ